MNRARISPAAKVQVTESLLLEGDVSEALPLLPDASVQCIITSPPYWGLRDYAIGGQIGLEPTLATYVFKLTALFSELRRILKPDGILWLNIGDGYTSGNRGWRAPDKKNPNRAMSVRPADRRPRYPVGGRVESRTDQRVKTKGHHIVLIRPRHQRLRRDLE